MKTFDLHVIYQFHSNTLGFSPGEVVELPSALLQCQDHSAAANSILKVAPGAYEKLEQTWDDWKFLISKKIPRYTGKTLRHLSFKSFQLGFWVLTYLECWGLLDLSLSRSVSLPEV